MFAYFLMESTDCNSEQHTCQLFLMSLILLTIGKTKVLHFYWNYFFISLAFQLDGIFLCKSFCLLKWSKPIWTQNNFTTKLGMVSSFFYFLPCEMPFLCSLWTQVALFHHLWMPWSLWLMSHLLHNMVTVSALHACYSYQDIM